jgi:hypothetical protein
MSLNSEGTLRGGVPARTALRAAPFPGKNIVDI